jgi:putative glutamine amidotransferase
MSGRPFILISPSTARKSAEFADASVSLSHAYPRAVIEAGGVPALLACAPSPRYVAATVARADGVLLTGGEDVQPGLHSPDLPPWLRRRAGPFEPERDLFELMLIREVFRQRKPLFAICRGHQLVNVAFGGTLVVDIPSQLPRALPHRCLERKNQPVHAIAFAPGSLMARLFRGRRVRVNSTHHQVIDRLADPFRATATGPDGLIEAAELAPHARALLPWFLSVQFHPERLVGAYPRFRCLFAAFVRACAAHRRSAGKSAA